MASMDQMIKTLSSNDSIPATKATEASPTVEEPEAETVDQLIEMLADAGIVENDGETGNKDTDVDPEVVTEGEFIESILALENRDA
jgi:hypothetical protein